jgi:hypothetical protein
MPKSFAPFLSCGVAIGLSIYDEVKSILSAQEAKYPLSDLAATVTEEISADAEWNYALLPKCAKGEED